jgi:ribosomal protein S18 acetylase RimI-like enzyme
MISISEIDETFDRWDELLAVILAAFAYMDGIIDPPSSAHQLTAENLREKARIEKGFVAIDGAYIAGCIFCRPETSGSLYIGKLAVSPNAQGKGVGSQLLARAENFAREKQLTRLRLETRIELLANHATFGAWGFEKTAENAHQGFTRPTSIEMTRTLD